MKAHAKRMVPLIAAFLLALCGATQARTLQVVTSTSWVGAIAQAAGADHVTVLAPFDLKHPAEYDFKPKDVESVVKADFVVSAGYEPFIKKLVTVAQVPESKTLTVYTDNVPSTLKQQTRKLADAFGTQKAEKRWEATYDKAVARVLEQARKENLPGTRVVVHRYLAEYAKWLGLDVVGVFGGGEEITPVQMAALIEKKATLVIDNWHDAQGEAIAREANARYVSLLNFPGHAGTRTLIDVLEYNARQLGL